jgi:hypothetical protein
VSLLLYTELLSTLVKKKPHYEMVFTEEAKLKKKSDGNIREQNVVTGKRIKKRSQAYASFLVDITNDQSLLA